MHKQTYTHYTLHAHYAYLHHTHLRHIHTRKGIITNDRGEKIYKLLNFELTIQQNWSGKGGKIGGKTLLRLTDAKSPFMSPELYTADEFQTIIGPESDLWCVLNVAIENYLRSGYVLTDSPLIVNKTGGNDTWQQERVVVCYCVLPFPFLLLFVCFPFVMYFHFRFICTRRA